MSPDPKEELVKALVESGMRVEQADVIADAVEAMIEAAAQEHREGAPHIYADGSTY